MSRRWFLFVLSLAIPVLFLVQVSNARFELRVNERASRFSFNELAPKVSLVVENGSGQVLPAVISLELLEPDNNAIAKMQQKTTLKTGSQELSWVLPLNTRDLSPDQETK